MTYRSIIRALTISGFLHCSRGSERALANSPFQPSALPVAEPAPAARIEPERIASFGEWLRQRVPVHGKVVVGEGSALAIVHTAVSGDTALTIAKAYVDLTTVYRAQDLAAELASKHHTISPATEVEIPHLVSAPYKTPDEDRMGWPADRVMKGVFISGLFAGSFWPETINKLASHGLNAVVLDAKDYMGTVNYPTHVKLAIDMGAAKDPPIPDYARAIRFAHARGVRVIARIPCFHDPWAAKHADRLSLMTVDGRPFEMGWIDPANLEAQDYIVSLVKEAVDLGADEVQLDYVRFPVYSPGIKYAAMPPADGQRSQATKAFVRKVHDATGARQVPLSLDVFGVAATGTPSDVEALGQNMAVIGGEAEALSPMVYPSHYAEGFLGFAAPGDHAEIVGMGTKAGIDKLSAANIKATIVRPWLQASACKTPTYGPKYIQDEIRSAEANGAVGWLMWDPNNSYWAVWQALPVVAGGKAVAKSP